MEQPTSERLTEMPFLLNIGLMMTLKCQVACPHCIVQAGPHRAEVTRLTDAIAWIDQIAVYRGGLIRVLSLTGGEPFYDLELLKQISEHGRERGFFVSAVTNAFWAADRAQADSLLAELDSIQMLSISTDVYHQERIPFAWVSNAIAAARERGIPYTVAVCTENDQDPAYLSILEALYQVTEPATVLPAITFPAGRALERAGTAAYAMVDTPPPSACGAGSAPIIFPDGRIIACIGPVVDLDTRHPLELGNLRHETLAHILDRAETNAVLHAIRVWGPQYLISLAREAGLGGHLPERYIEGSICNACYSLMATPEIVSFLEDLAQDAAFRRKIAYARVYYLGETEMVSALGLQG